VYLRITLSKIIARKNSYGFGEKEKGWVEYSQSST
jgi:hypothetical protein